MAIKLEEIEDKLAKAAEALQAEMQRLRHEWAVASENAKAVIEAEMDGVKEKAQATGAEVQAAMTNLQNMTDARIAALREQLTQAGNARKAEIEEHAAHAKAETHGVKEKVQALEGQAVAEMERAAHDSEAVITAYGDVVNQVSDATQAMIEKDIAEAQAERAKRMATLEEASRNIKKALGL